MTTQTPDAVREAIIEQAHAAVRNGDYRMGYLRMCEAYGMLAALDSRAGDAGEGWKAIETAPFDRMVLVDCERFETVCEAIQYRESGWMTFGVNGAFTCRPTAWREKPARAAATPAPAVDAKARADMAAALRNTPAEALREAGYLERAAKMIEAPALDAVPAGEVDKLIPAGQIAVGFKPHHGGPKPADWSGRAVQFRSGKVMRIEPGVVWKLGWDHSYGDGDVVAYEPASLWHGEGRK